MKFSIGDTVKIRKTGDEGVVVDIIQEQYMRVRVNDQVLPVEESDVDFPYLDWFLKARAENKTKKQYVDNLKVEQKERFHKKYSLSEGFYLIFQPIYREVDMEDIIHRFQVYVYNETMLDYAFMVSISTAKRHLFSYEGSLFSQQDMLLYTLTFDDASNNPSFEFEFSQNGKTYQQNVKLKRKYLIQKVTELQEKNLPLFEYQVFDQLNEKKEKIDISLLGKKKAVKTILGTPKTKVKAKKQIDLHIEKICNEFEQLSTAEILLFQLDYFSYYLDLALADIEVNPLRVVHGIGDGVLKKEINKLCKQTFGVERYVYEGYNPGVTLIYFKN